MLIKIAIVSGESTIELHSSIKGEDRMPCGVGNRKADLFNCSDYPLKRATSLQAATHCEVASNVPPALSYSREGHVRCNVRRYVINSTFICIGQNRIGSWCNLRRWATVQCQIDFPVHKLRFI